MVTKNPIRSRVEFEFLENNQDSFDGLGSIVRELQVAHISVNYSRFLFGGNQSDFTTQKGLELYTATISATGVWEYV